jgi:hypothetical protein
VSTKTFLRLAGSIFLLAAVVHLLRLVFNWEVVLAGWPAPVWLSAVAFVIAASLAYEGFRLSGRS